jgi:hypothetical protein
MLTFTTLAVLAAVVVHSAWREHQIQKDTVMNKQKILALLAIIAAQQIAVQHSDEARAASDKALADLRAETAELNDPDLVAAVDKVIANAAATPPPDAA